MQYNSQRDTLILREYGRTVQDMVDYCLTIENRELRQCCAEAIIDVMASMNPQTRQQPDYEHKLWNQLAIMSNYNLDIDYPHEIVRPDPENAKPAPLKYPMQRIRYRHYGHLIEAAMRKLGQMPDGPEREELVGELANAMKQNLFDFNPGSMDERKIQTDIEAYTEGEVELSDNFVFRTITSSKLPDKTSRKKKRK